MIKTDKRKKLEAILKRLKKVMVAYSGGVDSSLLLKVSAGSLGVDNVFAFIASSTTYPEREKKEAVEFCRSLGVRYSVIETDEMRDLAFIQNDKERCYHCKCHLYDEAHRVAKLKGFRHIIEGSNKDDLSDYRPGRKALKEKGVVSPLLEAGFTKAEIRALSKKLGLPTHNKPSKACLASRIPYGTAITEEILKKIDSAERRLEEMGFTQVRVRYHGNIARIEVVPEEMPALLTKRGDVVKYFSMLGFVYITLDMKGYQTGSMNYAIGK